MYELNERDLAIIKESCQVTIKSAPKLTVNEKIVTSGLTLIGIFFIGLVISILCLGISWIWHHIL